MSQNHLKKGKVTTINKCKRLYNYKRRLFEYKNSTTCLNRVDYVIFIQNNFFPVLLRLNR